MTHSGHSELIPLLWVIHYSSTTNCNLSLKSKNCYHKGLFSFKGSLFEIGLFARFCSVAIKRFSRNHEYTRSQSENLESELSSLNLTARKSQTIIRVSLSQRNNQIPLR